MKYSVIIPVFNGDILLKELFNKIQLAFKQLETEEYEVIFVHDYGSKESWNAIKGIGAESKDFVRCIKLTRNFGQHNAIISGITKSTGIFIITMDEDLQQDPLEIQLLVNKQLEDDYDVVYGRLKETKHAFFRNITSKMLRLLLRYGIPELHRDYSPFRLIKREIALALPEMRNSYTFLDGYIMWITSHIGSCPVSHHRRTGGKSSYTFKRLIKHSINIFFTFSSLPIHLLVGLSIINLSFSVFYSLFILFKHLIGNVTVPGYSSIIILLSFGIGSTMFGLSIIAEYLYRISIKSTKRPNYFVAKNSNNDDEISDSRNR